MQPRDSLFDAPLNIKIMQTIFRLSEFCTSFLISFHDTSIVRMLAYAVTSLVPRKNDEVFSAKKVDRPIRPQLFRFRYTCIIHINIFFLCLI